MRQSTHSGRPVLVEPLERRQLCTHFVHGTRVFADANFANANWSIEITGAGSSGTAVGVQAKKGGHPGKYRVITTTVDSGSADSIVFAFNADKHGIFNPAKSGAITTLNYREDAKLISGFYEGQRTGAALEQNGKFYFLLSDFLDTPNSTWTRITEPNLTAADFSTFDTGAHPDFSQTAAPIQFGFFRSNSSGYSGYSIEAGIDNWQLVLKTQKQVK